MQLFFYIYVSKKIASFIIKSQKYVINPGHYYIFIE